MADCRIHTLRRATSRRGTNRLVDSIDAPVCWRKLEKQLSWPALGCGTHRSIWSMQATENLFLLFESRPKMDNIEGTAKFARNWKGKVCGFKRAECLCQIHIRLIEEWLDADTHGNCAATWIRAESDREAPRPERMRKPHSITRCFHATNEAQPAHPKTLTAQPGSAARLCDLGGCMPLLGNCATMQDGRQRLVSVISGSNCQLSWCVRRLYAGPGV